MRMRFVLPATAAVVITVFAVISFARGAEVAAGNLTLAEAWTRSAPRESGAGMRPLDVVNGAAAGVLEMAPAACI